MKAIAAIALVALIGATATVASAVGATNCNGAGYDLSSLAGSDMMSTDSNYQYQLQVCALATQTDCNSHGGSFCQYGKAAPNTYQHVMTIWDGTGQWSTCTDQTKCPNGGFQVYFANGDGCGGTTGPKRQVTFYWACPAAGGTSNLNYVITQRPSPAQCVYDVVFTHNIGCGGGSGGGGSKGGLSGGSVFLIILVVIIPVYIIIGCIYKRQKMGTSGMESCPNIDFWRDLPSLVGDGFKFTFRKIGGLCGKGGADAPYENVK